MHRRRNHGSLIFIDLRDRDGITQVVFNPEIAPDAHRTAEAFRSEWVVQVKGEVSLRPKEPRTGISRPGVSRSSLLKRTVLNESLTPPFYVNEDTPTSTSCCGSSIATWTSDALRCETR